MRVLIVFAAALLAVVSALPAHEDWTLFKAKHGKSYGSLDEEKLRFQIFQDNVQKINSHNALYEAGLETYTMAVNKFADLTPKEFGAMFRHQNGPSTSKHLARHVQNQNLTTPEYIDWRQKNVVLEVKDQGKCKAGWAFSATGALEAQNAIKTGKLLSLSEQQLIDCDTNSIDKGCIDGDMTSAFDYIIKNGINSEHDYPFEGINNTCRSMSRTELSVKEARSLLEQTEAALREAVGTIGPICAAIYHEPIQFYQTGIFESSSCSNDLALLNHGVLVVGYGMDNDQNYWIIKNSWGADWGDRGYIRLARDANNQCGIAYDTVYPVLN